MENYELPVNKNELPEHFQFQASLSDHPIVLVKGGERLGEHYRYKQTIENKYEIDLNELWREYHAGKYTREWMMQYYRDIGYSLNGYDEVWGAVLEDMQLHIAASAPIDELKARWVNVNLADECMKAVTDLVDENEDGISSVRLVELLRLVSDRLS